MRSSARWVGLWSFAMGASCAADGGTAGAGGADPVKVTCVSARADTTDSLADAQLFRLTAPLGEPAMVTIERGDLNLFAMDEATARSYAAPSTGDNDFGRVQVEREVLAELGEDGQLHVGWSDGEIVASKLASLPALFEGHGTFGAIERSVTCWGSDLTLRYRYDADSGQCTSASGTKGRNALPLLYVHETGNAECNDFGDAEISTLGWPIYAGWNLRGADLSEAGFHFAFLPDADLSGADLATIITGYFNGTGTIDAHTKLPAFYLEDAGSISFGDIGTKVADQGSYYAWREPCAERPLAAHCVDLAP